VLLINHKGQKFLMSSEWSIIYERGYNWKWCSRHLTASNIRNYDENIEITGNYSGKSGSIFSLCNTLCLSGKWTDFSDIIMHQPEDYLEKK
jgi:hypothetical protein